MANESALFLSEFLRSPTAVGAIAPSSRRLSSAVAAPIPERGDPVVVELGAGTGPFTAEIQRRLGGRGRHLALEINPRLAGHLQARHPGLEVVVDDAARLPHLLAERGVEAADVIVSGLPWAAFSQERQARLLRAVVDALGPDGAFTTFSYVHARMLGPAVRFRRRLGQAFEEVVPGRTVWGNLPPAFVFHARRARAAAGPATRRLP
ncbi:methyltransferase domain-containing protein [Microtetraspora sp. AC03309]|uniref:class I SAM-dependent methyltransferase n=1 Tax=Microtetraspora sp. AC03309 TaxID=2779376 RepID=UPI000774CDAB|nr:methyltransferase domain-containing protein [Microtetraspora sp. AC03309]MCC5580095.1 methyltransferase domain-containing protein [Microtetraspora sp. AC03309]